MTDERPIAGMRLYRQKIGEEKYRMIQEYTPEGSTLGAPVEHTYEADDQLKIPVLVPAGPAQATGKRTITGDPELIQNFMPGEFPYPIHFKIQGAGNPIDAFDRYDAAYAAECAAKRPAAEQVAKMQGLKLRDKAEGIIVSGAGAHLPPLPGERGAAFRPKGKR